MATIPKTAEGIIMDSVEYLSELVISGDQEDHLENWSSLKYFTNQYKQTEGRSKFGRLNARMRMADITVYALHLLPYEDCSAARKMKIVPLVKWGPKSWDCLKRKLVGLRDCLVRKDAKRILLSPDNEIASPDPNREKSPIYNKQLNDLLVTMTANQMISSFRQELETGEPVSQSALEEFRIGLDELMDRKLRISLEVLLAAESQEEDTQNLSLADPETIKEALQERPLNLNTFQADVSELLNAWYQDVFAKRKPALVRLKYGEERGELPFDEVSPQDNDNENTPPFDDDEDGEGKQRLKTPAELREMRKARKTLQERAIDPLPESYEVATGAAPAPRKRSAREEDLEEESSVDSPSPKRSRSSKAGFYGRPKKKTARVEFDDSDEEEEELSEVRLSDIPQHHNYSNNSPAKIEGQRSAASRTSSGPKQRQKFSPEEKRAIREGVLKFGEGKWARIKSEYAAILQNRTNVNIKDCWRTMKKNHEV